MATFQRFAISDKLPGTRYMLNYDTPPNHIRHTDHEALRRPRPSQTSGADRDLALLRAAVPAGAQREGLNVHLPRESRPLEVAAEV